MLKNILLLLCSLTLTAELSARLTGLDYLMLKPLLYYQTSDQAVHEVSPNPERLYQLKPISKTSTVEFQHIVSVNRLGFRGPEAEAKKLSGVTRIICFGGSTTYGAAVADHETFPYYLERELNSYFHGKFEVWNAGLCAYVLAQEAAYARETVDKYAPDILIFQHANQGRRAFLPDTPYSQFFRGNPELYRENLRFIPFPENRLSLGLLKHSAAYRSVVVLANCFLFIDGNNPRFNSERTNLEAFSSFYADIAPRIPAFILTMKIIQDCPPPEFSEMIKRIGVPLLDIFSKDSIPENVGEEYFLIHPPAHVYEWYAKAIALKLEKQGLVKKK